LSDDSLKYEQFLLVAAPLGASLSSLIAALRERRFEFSPEAGLPEAAPDWPVLTATAIEKEGLGTLLGHPQEARGQGLIVLYDTMRVVTRGYGAYDRDPVIRAILEASVIDTGVTGASVPTRVSGLPSSPWRRRRRRCFTNSSPSCAPTPMARPAGEEVSPGFSPRAIAACASAPSALRRSACRNGRCSCSRSTAPSRGSGNGPPIGAISSRAWRKAGAMCATACSSRRSATTASPSSRRVSVSCRNWKRSGGKPADTSCPSFWRRWRGCSKSCSRRAPQCASNAIPR
jgi:hypothetical protein